MVRALFSVARTRQPSVVFIDEIDSILSSRSEGQHEASRRLETEFLVQMDGVNGNAEERVILIGATNRPQELDEAVRRRFTKRIYVDLPNGKAREELILHLMSNVPYKLGSRDLKQLAKLTEGYSGSDLSALCKEAAMFPVRGLSHRELQEGKIPPVSINHFRAAMEVIRPSVSQQSLNFYMRWNSEFGSRAG
jgi:SpoVK/Ycf46/Vps4 family AAA+-type ATPase